MRTRFRRANLLAGAASVRLFPAPTDPRRLLDDIAAQAAAAGMPVDAMLGQCMAERRMGQALFTGVSLAAVALAATGAVAGWPDGVLLVLAALPAALALAVAWGNGRFAPAA